MNNSNQSSRSETPERSSGKLHRQLVRRGDARWPHQLKQSEYDFLDIVGDQTPQHDSSLAIFSSSKCPGAAILKSTKWVGELADDESRTVISGFHSAMEKCFLEILLEGRCRVVVCPARSLHRYRVPTAYKSAIEDGRLAIVSCLPESVRSNSAASSAQRNRLVAILAREIVFSHAAERSRTEQFGLELLSEGRAVCCLDTGCNTLLSAGARLVPLELNLGADGKER